MGYEYIVAAFAAALIIGAISRAFIDRKSWMVLIVLLVLICVALWAVMR